MCIDAVLGALIALLVIALAPGLAIVALIVLLASLICVASLAVERVATRRRRRRR